MERFLFYVARGLVVLSPWLVAPSLFMFFRNEKFPMNPNGFLEGSDVSWGVFFRRHPD